MAAIEKVVVIDDDAISGFIAKSTIKKIDLATRIKVITDPKLALKFLEERCIEKSDGICPELILLDFNFPTTNAIEILEELKCKGLVIGKNIILIILSSIDIREEDKLKLIELKVSDFLLKPITEQKLEEIVDKYL